MKTIHFKQKLIFKTTPEEIYNALMDSKKHSQFTGGKAVIGKRAGDDFTAYDGYIKGNNIELIPGKKIVQTWKTTDDGWPEEHYSTIEFVFKKTKEGTELQFTHTNIPTTVKADYEQGWEDYYWEPMKAMLEE
ncbi:MAG: SRPBCC domain-containing protein [Bacteroidia bacterium]